MPVTAEAARMFKTKNIPHAPGKASNAGGVAVSGLEQTQNSMRVQWSKEKVDRRLEDIMTNIHQKCVEHGSNEQWVDYVKGANIAGFFKVAKATLAMGI
jgi:glutamate dehydrogenase (NADP+)